MLYSSTIPGYNIIKNHLINYPTPSTLNYFWGFGSLAGLLLIIQVITGLFLSMHYVPNALFAFDSIEHIIRDVNYGWLLKSIHANGASFFFIVVYIHLGRSLYFQSYNTKLAFVWISGIIIFIVMMSIAFLGYILPWGQMSLWGATVITNLFSAIPFVGKSIVFWLWGGFSVDTPTLIRFYTLHYTLPFILLGLVLLHLILLHWWGSSFPLKSTGFEYIRFFPYFYLKDLFGFLIITFIFSFIVFFHPNILGHVDNYIPANSLVTPIHIVPEWYFLPFYAMLRAIPNKLGGVILMFSSLLILFFISIFSNLFLMKEKYCVFTNFFINCITVRLQTFYQIWFWLLVSNFITLGWLGAQTATEPYITISLCATFLYFFLFTLGCSISRYLDCYFLCIMSRPIIDLR